MMATTRYLPATVLFLLLAAATATPSVGVEASSLLSTTTTVTSKHQRHNHDDNQNDRVLLEIHSPGQDHILVEPWGPNTLRVRVTAPGAPFNALVPSALHNNTRPPPNNETTITSFRKGSGLVITNGNLRAVIEENSNSLISFSRVSDNATLLRETRRVTPETSRVLAGKSAPCSVSFSAEQEDLVFGLGQGVPFLPYPTFRPWTLNHKGDNISFATCAANEGGAANCLPWYFVVRNGTENSGGGVRDVPFGFIWNVPALGGEHYDNLTTSFWADAAWQLDYLVTIPPAEASVSHNVNAQLTSLFSQYTALIGRTYPMPSSLLGYWHSKNVYRTQTEVLDAMAGFRNRSIPVDVFIIDIGGSKGKIQGDWSFNPEQFPDPSAMTAELAKTNTRVMVSCWAGTDIGSFSWENLVKNHSWVVVNTSSPGGTAPIPWPLACNGPNCFLYDASNPDARAYVWSKISEGYVKHNISLFWLDGSEPQPPILGWGGTPLFSEGRYQQGRVREVGMAFTRWHTGTFYEGFQKEGLKDSVMLARSGWFGTAAHGAALWSGDTLSDWITLKTSIVTGLGAQLSGIAWWTTDVGGYRCWNTSTMPESELVVRWFQFGMTCPILRQHGNRPETVPWAYGPVAEAAIVKIIRQRAAMKDYLRAQHDLLAATGMPFNRPLWFDFPNDATVWTLNDPIDQYMMGSSYLAAPVYENGARWRNVYLPTRNDQNTKKSIVWQHVYSGKNFTGGSWYNVSAPLDEFPLFLLIEE